VGTEPAYTRLRVDERRRQLIEAGAALFAERSYEEISMQDVARSAGVSKPLLYHYFPSKAELFKAAVNAKATELQATIEPGGEGTALEQLAHSLDTYLAWIEDNGQTWSKLMQSASVLPDRQRLARLHGRRHPRLDQDTRRPPSQATRPPGRSLRRQPHRSPTGRPKNRASARELSYVLAKTSARRHHDRNRPKQEPTPK
jgi:AcrR family transcriptional regulator